MKNRLLSTIIILVLSVSFIGAQESPRVSFGILGGVNAQNINGKLFDGNKIEDDMLIGYHAGFNVQIPLATDFYFQPGVMYSIKGAKNESLLGTKTTTLNYIEVPLNLVYKAPLGNGFFMLGFGPYLAYAINGNVKTTGGGLSLDQDITFKNTVETGDNILLPYYKAYDAGANIFVGFELGGGLFLQLDTQLGLLNINPEFKGLSIDESMSKNTGFGLSLGYRF